MKCITCDGTGLYDDNRVCPVCKGFGIFVDAEPIEESTEVKAEVKKVVKKSKNK